MSEQNGTGPRIQRRETWVELPEEYAGFRVKVWVNAPSGLWRDMADGETDTIQEAASKLILEHNGWLDFDGQPYPVVIGKEFWDAIPTELAATLISAASAEMMKLPNSLTPTRRRSRRG